MVGNVDDFTVEVGFLIRVFPRAAAPRISKSRS